MKSWYHLTLVLCISWLRWNSLRWKTTSNNKSVSVESKETRKKWIWKVRAWVKWKERNMNKLKWTVMLILPFSSCFATLVFSLYRRYRTIEIKAYLQGGSWSLPPGWRQKKKRKNVEGGTASRNKMHSSCSVNCFSNHFPPTFSLDPRPKKRIIKTCDGHQLHQVVKWNWILWKSLFAASNSEDFCLVSRIWVSKRNSWKWHLIKCICLHHRVELAVETSRDVFWRSSVICFPIWNFYVFHSTAQNVNNFA